MQNVKKRVAGTRGGGGGAGFCLGGRGEFSKQAYGNMETRCSLCQCNPGVRQCETEITNHVRAAAIRIPSRFSPSADHNSFINVRLASNPVIYQMGYKCFSPPSWSPLLFEEK